MGLLRETSARENSATVLTVVLSVGFVILYSLAFPRTLGHELFLVPDSVASLSEDLTSPLQPGGRFFELAGREGYWDSQGRLLRAQPQRPQSVSSGDRMAWYDASLDSVTVEGTQGVLFRIKGQKYPFWSGGQLYAMDENRLGLTAYDVQGQLLWTKQFSSLISAVDSAAGLTAVGTLDGRVQTFDAKGATPGPFVPGGSRVPVVYNVALSHDGKRMLVLAGVDPKRFLMLEKGGSDFRPIFHKPLSENKPWPTWLGFLDDSLGYHEAEGAVAVSKVGDSSGETILPFDGVLGDVHFLTDRRLVLLMSGTGDRHTVQVDSLEGQAVLRLTFQAKEVLFAPTAKQFLLGLDQSLLTLQVKYQ
ncbi:MAG: hypothetical protein WCG80_07720 [Spirochaetales bacterium]